MTLWSLVWGLAFSLLVVNRFGRRTLFLASTAGLLVCYVVWTALEATYEMSTYLGGTGSPGVAKGVVAMIFLYNLIFCIGWGPLQVTCKCKTLLLSLPCPTLQNPIDCASILTYEHYRCC